MTPSPARTPRRRPDLWVAPPVASQQRQRPRNGPARPIPAVLWIAPPQPPQPPPELEQLAAIARELRWGRADRC